MSICFVECPSCKELASIHKNSITTTVHCKCGVIEMETQVEEDRHYVIYNNFLDKYGDTVSPVYTDVEETI